MEEQNNNGQLQIELKEEIKVENNTISVKELSHCKFVTIWVK